MRRSALLLLVVAAALGAGSVAAFVSFTSDLAGSHRILAAGGAKIVATSSGPVEYAERGPTDRIPLLSIHGAGGGWDQGLANAADLVGERFRVVAPSRFGYLGTPIPADVSPAAQADAHANLLSSLKVPKAIVVGVSAGARSALELALRHPSRVGALILVSPGTYSPDSPVRVDPSVSSQVVLRFVNAGGDFAWWAAEKIAPSALIRFVGVEPDVVAHASKVDQDRVTAVVDGIEPLSLRFPGINIDSNPNLRPMPLNEIAVPTDLRSRTRRYEKSSLQVTCAMVRAPKLSLKNATPAFNSSVIGS